MLEADSALGAQTDPKDYPVSQSDGSLSQISLRVLCKQARYIVVYLDRAIEFRDAKGLPLLVQDLERISSVMPSQRMKVICNDFVTAAAKESWCSIQLLQKELEEELSNLSEGSASSVELAKAG